LAAIGRTEDVRLAPSGRRLAIACYGRDRVAVADVEIAISADGPTVAVPHLYEFSSAVVREPHGIDFLDDDTLIVASRTGGVAVFRLPEAPAAAEAHLTPSVASDGGTEMTGSVAVHRLDDGRREVLVCNNSASTVTRHSITVNEIAPGAVAARKWLATPDGVAISADHRCVVVSNHDTHCVLVYEHTSMGEAAEPVGVLRGVHYPHGLRFAADGRFVLVADAGAPHVHVFERPNADWHGVSYPAATVRVMDDETFAAGRHNPQEGGPKGLDVDARTNVLVVTSERVPLAFFDFAAVLQRPDDFAGGQEAALRYELHALASAARLREAAAATRAELVAIMRTKAWRLTAPARRLYGALRRLRAARRPGGKT